jgi:multimeric flavodoxin WrbA
MRVNRILILNGSPVRDGNTTALTEWFQEGISKKADVEIVRVASLKLASNGCLSCRGCQKTQQYSCLIKDDAKSVLAKMRRADVIVFATPLYFYGPSAQLKIIIDRMFSLYKWDNSTDTFKSPLKKKTMVLLLSAYEDIGLDMVEGSFALIAKYTGMGFKSLLVPGAGVSGQIHRLKGVREKAIALGNIIHNVRGG